MQNTTKCGADVVPLWMYQTAMDNSPLNQLKSYWSELRAGRLVPLRSEIDPRDIADLLENSFILERVQPGMVKFRLSGNFLNDILGMEARGMPLRSLIRPGNRAEFSADLEAVFDKPEIHEYHLISDAPRGPAMHARMLILPLKCDLGTVDRAIGCLVSDAPAPQQPCRFSVTEARVTEIATGKISRKMPDNAIVHDPNLDDVDAPRPPRAVGKPDLRLVKTD